MPLELTFVYVTKIGEVFLKILVIFTIQNGSELGSTKIRDHNVKPGY